MATSDELLAAVKLRCGWPTTAPISDANLLLLADDVVRSELWPLLLTTRGDYHTATAEYAVTANKYRYRIPANAIYPIRDIKYRETSTSNPINVPQVNIEDIGAASSGDPYAFYIDGDFIALDPVPTTTEGTLIVRYYRAPNKLCLESAAREVASITSSTVFVVASSFTGTTIPTTGTSFVDVICSSGAHAPLYAEVVVDCDTSTSVAVNNVIEAEDGVHTWSTEDLQGSTTASNREGDWIAPVGQTPLVPVPDQVVPLVTARVAWLALNAAGDAQRMASMKEHARVIDSAALQAVMPRSEAEPTTVVQRNGLLNRIAMGRFR